MKSAVLGRKSVYARLKYEYEYLLFERCHADQLVTLSSVRLHSSVKKNPPIFPSNIIGFPFSNTIGKTLVSPRGLLRGVYSGLAEQFRRLDQEHLHCGVEESRGLSRAVVHLVTRNFVPR